jgi:predicted RNA binding protein with dsRBD fold (UPF0201 family)
MFIRNSLFLFLIFNFFSTIFSLKSVAQENKKNEQYFFQGNVVDAQNTLRPLIEVAITNLSSKETFKVDENGKFNLKVNDGDTLRFKQLGYHTKFYFFKKVLNVPNYSVQILMTSDTITLKPFVYKSLNKEREIQNAFMNSYIRDSLRMIEYLRKMMDDKNKSFLENAVAAYSSPVTFIYDQFGKKARQRNRIDRYRQIIREEKEKKEPDYAK